MPGDFFGLIDDRYYTKMAEAVVASGLWCFRKDALEEMVAKYPEMHHNLLCMARKSLRYTRENQFLLGWMTSLEKVVSFLIICARQAREAGLPDNSVRFVMNRTDISNYLGLTIETVSCSFSRLKAQGLIRFAGSSLVHIDDMAALRFTASIHDAYHH